MQQIRCMYLKCLTPCVDEDGYDVRVLCEHVCGYKLLIKMLFML